MKRNLARLEIRFLERFQSSVEKEKVRSEQGKPAHKTILQSIEENRQRLEQVRMIRRVFVDGTTKTNADKKKNER